MHPLRFPGQSNHIQLSGCLARTVRENGSRPVGKQYPERVWFAKRFLRTGRLRKDPIRLKKTWEMAEFLSGRGIDWDSLYFPGKSALAVLTQITIVTKISFLQDVVWWENVNIGVGVK